jgi:PAS domain S-box-containing protein
LDARTSRTARGDLTLAGFSAAAAVVLTLLAATYWLSLQQRQAATWVGETQRVLRSIAGTRAALVDVQNGHRGFTIEGSEQAMQTYREAVAAIGRETRVLRSLFEDTPDQQRHLEELQRLLSARLASAAQLIEARRTGGFAAAKHIVDTGWPAAPMIALRGTLQAMELQQEQLLQQRLAAQDRSLHWFWAAVGSMTTGLALTLVVIYLQVRRRQADQERLLESEERLRLMTASVVDHAIFMLDPEGRVRSWNPGAERILGYREDEITSGAHLSSFYSEPDVRSGLPAADMHVAVERGHSPAEGWKVRRDGSRLWASSVLSAMRSRDGQLRGFCVVLRDLTEPRRAEESLRSEMAARARTDEELQRLNRSLEGLVAERTRELQCSNAELEAARRRLQDLSSLLMDAQEQERGRVARELHDDTGQSLAAIRLRLMEMLRGTAGAERMNESVAIVDRAIAQIRGMALQLRPTMLDDLGLVDALEWAAGQQAKASGWTVQLALDASCPRLPREVETACFRIVQEALTNVARHAQATRLSLQLRISQERLEFAVEDDGSGFDPLSLRSASARATRFGLLSMTERAHLLGGQIEIDSAPGRGTRIRASLPIASQPEGRQAGRHGLRLVA